MLGSAICGCISPVAYLGAVEAAGHNASSFLPAGEFIRIELPPPLAAPRPAAAPTAAGEVLLPQPAAPQVAAEPAAVQYAAATAGPGGDDMAHQGSSSGVREATPKTAPAPYIPVSLAGLSYDLAGGATSANAIQTEKPIQISGAARARIKVRIDENAKIYVDARQLASLLPAESLPQARNGFVSFDQLRSSGIGVRYDAAMDTIEMQPGGA